MSNDLLRIDLTPLLTSIKKGVDKYLPEASDSVSILLTSTPLTVLTTTTIKNLLYIGLGREFGLHDPCHFFSARVDYFESALICVASLVHHLVMGIIYSALTVITLGLSSHIQFSFKKHWLQSMHAVAGVGISLLGTLVPTLGAYANVGFIALLSKSVISGCESDLALFEEPLLNEIKGIYSKNKDLISEFIRSYVNDHKRFDGQIETALNDFGYKIVEVKKLSELQKLVTETLSKFPSIQPSTLPSTPMKQRQLARSTVVV